MPKYQVQLRPDYVDGDSYCISIWTDNGEFSVNTLGYLIERIGLNPQLLLNITDRKSLVFLEEFVEDRVSSEDIFASEVLYKPEIGDTKIFADLERFRESQEFYVHPNQHHPSFTKLNSIGLFFSALAIIEFFLIFRIEGSPGDTNTKGWQLAIFSSLLSAFAVFVHTSIGKAGANIGSKFPKPTSLNYLAGEFAVWMFIFVVAFS